MLEKIIDYYTNLSEREQKLVALAGIIAAIILLMGVLKQAPVLFAPSIRTQVNAKLSKFEQVLPELNKLKVLNQQSQQHRKFSEADLYEYINNKKPVLNTYKRDQLVLEKIDDKVSIKYKAVSFDEFILWLTKLHQDYGVSIISADIKPVPTKAGYVQVNVVLL